LIIQKKIVLYAPTFRKEVEKSISVYNLDFERISQALSKRFDGEFLVLYRFHHMLYETNYNYECIPMGINVSSYPDVMELLLISDVLITDYSSIMWDFSLMRRPVFLYHNDIEEYDRGFYCDPDEWPYPKAKTSDEMVSKINNFDEEQYVKDLGSFFQRFHSFDDGHASECIVNRIVDVMSNPSKYGKK
jgi:CDP-glycerol glycerophosphotransferase